MIHVRAEAGKNIKNVVESRSKLIIMNEKWMKYVVKLHISSIFIEKLQNEGNGKNGKINDSPADQAVFQRVLSHVPDLSHLICGNGLKDAVHQQLVRQFVSVHLPVFHKYR